MCFVCRRIVLSKMSDPEVAYSVRRIFEELPKCPAMIRLEMLSPGGSEFVDDPKACYDYARDKVDHLWESVRKRAIELRMIKKALSEFFTDQEIKDYNFLRGVDDVNHEDG